MKNEEVVVVIVDNASQNGDLERLSSHYRDKPEVKVLSSDQNGGYSQGNNIGLRYLLRHEPDIQFVAVMNPDVRVAEQNAFSKLADALESDDQLGMVAPFLIEEGKINLLKTGWNLLRYRDILRQYVYILQHIFPNRGPAVLDYHSQSHCVCFDTVQGSLFLMRMDLFNRIGFFDEHLFLYSEEDILGYKLHRIGKRAGVLLDFGYEHHHQAGKADFKDVILNLRQKFVSYRYYLRAYPKIGTIRYALLCAVVWNYLYFELPVANFLKEIGPFGTNKK